VGVGPGFDCHLAIHRLAARGEDQDRQLLRSRIGAQRASNAVAAHAWHHQVDDRQIEALGQGLRKTFFTAFRQGNLVPFALQHQTNHLKQTSIVVYDQYSCHVLFLRRLAYRQWLAIEVATAIVRQKAARLCFFRCRTGRPDRD
jgi:hypothetical protein